MEYDEEGDDLRSETLSASSQDEGPSEPPASRRERLRAVLLPAIQSRVTALGGWVDVQLPAEEQDEAADDEEEHDADVEPQMRTVRVYKLGDEALGCLKDLKRFWRMDDNDDDRTIGRMFYETGLLKNDLLPILNCANQPNPSIRQTKASLAAGEPASHCQQRIDITNMLRSRSDCRHDLAHQRRRRAPRSACPGQRRQEAYRSSNEDRLFLPFGRTTRLQVRHLKVWCHQDPLQDACSSSRQGHEVSHHYTQTHHEGRV